MGGTQGSFLIEFPDKTEINLTPLKFDYSSAAEVPCPIIVRSMFLSSSLSHLLLFLLIHSLTIPATPSKTLLICITLSRGLSEAWTS